MFLYFIIIYSILLNCNKSILIEREKKRRKGERERERRRERERERERERHVNERATRAQQLLTCLSKSQSKRIYLANKAT